MDKASAAGNRDSSAAVDSGGRTDQERAAGHLRGAIIAGRVRREGQGARPRLGKPATTIDEGLTHRYIKIIRVNRAAIRPNTDAGQSLQKGRVSFWPPNGRHQNSGFRCYSRTL